MKLTVKLIASITIVTIIIIIGTTNFFWASQKNILLQQAHIQAKTLFEMIVITRQWVAENRDAIEPVPAVATRQLSDYAAVMSDFRFHITSDQLINPENAPDAFEKRALKAFRTENIREYEEIITDRGEKFYKYMAPLYVNNACMECHEYQGYDIGDLRGGISVTLPLKSIISAMKQNNRNYFTIGFISFMGIVLTVTFLLRKMVLKNIDTLTKAAISYKTGDFSNSLSIKTGDEIQELSEAFEMMRQSILENEENLKSQLNKVTKKYEGVLGQLENRNDELKSINLFKTDILDSLAHELRTPLTKIMAYSNILMEQGLDCSPDVRNQSLDAINRSSKLLNNLFNEIITLSRLDSKQYPYHFIPVDISLLINEISNQFEKDIIDKNITMTINVPPQTRMCVDGESFRHVITNIISNAVKFNKHEGAITIDIVDSPTCKTLIFSDTGAGIPENELEKVQKRFFRGSNVKREFPGTGLGLSIVSRIVQGHNGRMSIESEVDKGTVFKISIPKKLQCSQNLDTPSVES
jgi:signal transduction histidine kinase